MFGRVLNTPLSTIQKQPSRGVLRKRCCENMSQTYKGTRNFIEKAKQSNFIEIALQHGSSPENLLHIFGTSFSKNTSEGLPLSNMGPILFLNFWNDIFGKED